MHFVDAKALLSARNGFNLYRGCTHGCIYCDSRSACYRIEHAFEDVAVKRNAPELLDAALRAKRRPCMLGTGSMCDPYLPLEKELRLTRVFAIVLPLGALVIALYIKNAYNILMFAWSFYAAAAGLPAFAALYWKKATKAGILAGMGAGFSVTIVWKLLGQPFGLGATVPGAIACALALVLVSLATCKKHPSTFLDPREKAAA